MLKPSRAHTEGGGPLIPCLPSNAGRGGHKTCSHSSTSTQETPWQLGVQKWGPPRHSTHALASIVKRRESSTSVFFKAEITEGALMWNHPPFISPSFVLLLSPCSPSLSRLLHGCGSKCEALITPWLFCFKRSCYKSHFPLRLPVWILRNDCTFSFTVSQKHQRNNHNLLENAACEFQHSFSIWRRDSPVLTVQKDDCLGLELSGKLCGRLWKRARWLSL